VWRKILKVILCSKLLFSLPYFFSWFYTNFARLFSLYLIIGNWFESFRLMIFIFASYHVFWSLVKKQIFCLWKSLLKLVEKILI